MKRTLLLIALLSQTAIAQEDIGKAISGLSQRAIGPAVMGGRIADVAVSTHHASTWYVAVGSGGVWKTTNAGTTWKSIFDGEKPYSIGDIALDPNNPDVVWVGTGENVSGRHVAWGEGVYRSRDGGNTWEQVGLEDSEHIGKILIDPRDSNTIYVAAEGPLWSAGGERGVFKSTDGGDTWTAALEIDENTGITDLEFDPSNPDVLYAASYQRRRHIWSLLAGGPESGIYKSMDAGATWRRIRTGLPKGDVGKIGLAVTPANPDIVFATMEANQEERGFYRSMDKGESWTKRNSYISGGTGPHYYQELEASPVNPDLIYQMDVFLHVTRDGGASFRELESGWNKHSDNHAMWIDPDNGDHMLVGTDAGLYETFDEGKTFRHFENLPIAQFYFVAADNAEPFYNVLGGAQDLGTLYGPSRTMMAEGVSNRDWYVPLGADGADVQFDPTDPNTFYMETQQGNIVRYDKRTEEAIDIQPQPTDEPARWNWNAPIFMSPHNTDRLYFGSQQVWRTDDRGDSWTAISGDLTTNRNRYELELMDRVWSVDALYHNGAMSKYATLTAIAESPLREGLLYTGSDDGMLHVSEDGGANWRKMAPLPGVPDLSFINDVVASRHSEGTVYVAADAHKFGDYKPYFFKSADNGASWQSMNGDLPDETIVWAIDQDHIDEDLIFIGTEYGLYATINGGTNWHKINSDANIAYRDIVIQQRESDVVSATFGRGFYVLDDYSPLRHIGDAVAGSGALFPVRDAWWYLPLTTMQAPGKPTLGSTNYSAKNPPFGATFTYFIPEIPKTASELREEAEKEIRDAGGNVPFPGYETLEEEAKEGSTRVMLLVRDASDQPVRWVSGVAKAGMHRVNWDLRTAIPHAIDLSVPDFRSPWQGEAQGPLAAPGRYSVELMMMQGDQVTPIGERQTFTVKPTPNTPSDTDFEAVAAFQLKTADLLRGMAGAGEEAGQVRNRMRYMRAALVETPKAPVDLFGRIDKLSSEMTALEKELFGDRVRGRLREPSLPTASGRAGRVAYGHWDSRVEPTATQRANLELAESGFAEVRGKLVSLLRRLSELEAEMQEAGAPWTPGQSLQGLPVPR